MSWRKLRGLLSALAAIAVFGAVLVAAAPGPQEDKQAELRKEADKDWQYAQQFRRRAAEYDELAARARARAAEIDREISEVEKKIKDPKLKQAFLESYEKAKEITLEQAQQWAQEAANQRAEAEKYELRAIEKDRTVRQRNESTSKSAPKPDNRAGTPVQQPRPTNVRPGEVTAPSGVRVTDTQRANPAGRVSVAEARKQIEAHVASINSRREKMHALYYGGNATQTLKAAFQKQGVSAGRDAATPGGSGLMSGWLDADSFYWVHLQFLNESLRSMPDSGFVNQNHVTYLAQGMQAWKENERQLQRFFLEAVDVYTRYALNRDKKDVIGAKIEKLRDAAKAISLAEWGRVYEETKVQAEQELRPLQLEEKQIDEAYARVWRGIAETYNKRLFEPIKAWASARARSQR